MGLMVIVPSAAHSIGFFFPYILECKLDVSVAKHRIRAAPMAITGIIITADFRIPRADDRRAELITTFPIGDCDHIGWGMDFRLLHVEPRSQQVPVDGTQQNDAPKAEVFGWRSQATAQGIVPVIVIGAVVPE